MPTEVRAQVVEGSTLKQLADAYNDGYVIRAELTSFAVEENCAQNGTHHSSPPSQQRGSSQLRTWQRRTDVLSLISRFAYSGRYGASLRVRGKSVLLLPVDMIQAFFRPAISKCIAHVKELLEARRTK